MQCKEMIKNIAISEQYRNSDSSYIIFNDG